MTLASIFLIVALILSVIAALPKVDVSVNLVPLGLAFLVAAMLVPMV